MSERGRVVRTPWLLSTWSWSKAYSRYSVMCLGRTLYGALPCLVVVASSLKFQSYLYKIKKLKNKKI